MPSHPLPQRLAGHVHPEHLSDRHARRPRHAGRVPAGTRSRRHRLVPAQGHPVTSLRGSQGRPRHGPRIIGAPEFLTKLSASLQRHVVTEAQERPETLQVETIQVGLDDSAELVGHGRIADGPGAPAVAVRAGRPPGDGCVGSPEVLRRGEGAVPDVAVCIVLARRALARVARLIQCAQSPHNSEGRDAATSSSLASASSTTRSGSIDR
jgi:hypothetical protein